MRNLILVLAAHICCPEATNPNSDTSWTSRKRHPFQTSRGGGLSRISSPQEQLRKELLHNYNKGSFPLDPGRQLDVGLNIYFSRIRAVDVKSSVIDLVVWVREKWVDPRLSWDPSEYPSEYGNHSETWFWIGDGSGSGGETSEIWTPDIELWNREYPFSETLRDSHAKVSSDGTVFWSRVGHLKPVCNFEGLENFPYDELECTIEIGSLAYSSSYLRLSLLNESYLEGDFSVTSGEIFSEFTIKSITNATHTYTAEDIGIGTDDGRSVIFYKIKFARAWEPYARGFITIQIALNLIGFCCFWIPPHLGERMGLSITAMLAAVASELGINKSLPFIGELTWYSKFSFVSMIYAIAVIFQSAIVVYFYHHTGSSLVPSWWKRIYCYKQHKSSKDLIYISKKAVCSDGMKEDYNYKALIKNVGTKSSQIDHVPESIGESSNCVSSHSEQSRQDLSRRSSLGGFNDFRDIQEYENNKKWKQVAIYIDDISRLIFPSSFVVFLAEAFLRVSDLVEGNSIGI